MAGERIRFAVDSMATLRGIEAMDMVRKGRVKRVAKGDPIGQAKFISNLFAA